MQLIIMTIYYYCTGHNVYIYPVGIECFYIVGEREEIKMEGGGKGVSVSFISLGRD